MLPAGSYRAAAFLAAARRLDVELAILTNARLALAEHSDVVIVEDLADPKLLAEACALLGSIDAVVGVDDAAVVASAYLAEHHGLVHHSLAGTIAALDKAAQRALFAAAGVDQPDFALLAFVEDPALVAASVGFPCVIKATGLSAGRGVLRVDNPTDARWASARVREVLSAAGRDSKAALLVEGFIDGPEVAVEGLVVGGALFVLAIFDKPGQAQGPTFPETMLVTPSRLAPEALAAVEALTARAALALGLTDGPVHAELRLGPTGPRLLELNPRSIGGLCGRTLHFNGGASLEEVLLCAALGWPTPLQMAPGASGVYMVDVPRPGRFLGVRGADAARAIAGIDDVVITMASGSIVTALPDGGEYLGFVFATAPTPEEVETVLRSAVEVLTVQIEPNYRLAGV